MKNFDFFSLDFVYYPVSGIMWAWHRVFGALLGANNAWAWVLSVVFLVFTLRSLLFKPFMGQMNSQLKMQAHAPEMKKIRERYKDDKPRMAEELQKYNKEAGVNPLSGCLPALIQAPVFIGLYHVLKMFRPGQNENYFFGASDVQSFVDAKLFGGAPLSAFMTMPLHSTARQIGLLELGGIRSTVITVGLPLTILAGIATFLTSRRSVARQQQMQGANDAMPQAALMNTMMKYVFPLFVVVGGPFFPLAILVYWLSNNTWTFGQLYVAHRIQDRKLAEQSQVVDAAREQAKFSTPAAGARPTARSGPAKPAVGAKPVRPANMGRPATATTTPGGRPTTAPKRVVVQPSKSGSTPLKPPVSPGRGSVEGGTANGTGPSLTKAAAGTGRRRPDDGAPSMSSDGGSSPLPPGMISDASKPKRKTTATKKKPGRR